MKILQINSVCGSGSTGRITVELYHMATEQGHVCKIAYGRANRSENVETIRIGNKQDVYSHVIMSRLTDRQGFYSQKATKKFIEKIERFSPDVIHLHNLHGYYLNLPILFQYLAKSEKKVIWTLHDCWSFTGHCTHFCSIGCLRWKTECFQCPKKQEYPKSFLWDSSRKNYQEKKQLFTKIRDMIIVTPSKWLAGLVEQSFLGKYPVEIIPNGIDTNIFRPRSSNFREKYKIGKKQVILGVANVWNERKGLHDFFELAKLLDLTKQQIVLVGLKKKQIRNLPEGIVGLDHISDTKELAEIYSIADIFFNPTYEENYPTTNLEAAACGSKVISYDTGGSRETIFLTDGIVVKIGDYRKIIDLLKNKKSRKMDYKFLDKEERFKKYIELYNCLRWD